MPKRDNFTAIYESLKDYVSEVTKGNLKNEELLLTMIKAAIMKCFEFNLFISKLNSPEYAFFAATNLRGSCEDLIVLKYLKDCLEKQDIQDFLLLSAAENFQDGIESQVNFFKTYRPLQPIIENYESFSMGENKRRAKRNYLKNKYKWGRKRPQVREMAVACELESLYDYLYAATSKSVHFNPQVLLRMGWGYGDVNDPAYKYSNSINHFSGYHADFSRFYGSFLFVEFVKVFKQYLNLPVEIIELTEQLKKLLDDEIRWPEIVTFEEMNITAPSTTIYALASVVAKDVKNDKLSET